MTESLAYQFVCRAVDGGGPWGQTHDPCATDSVDVRDNLERRVDLPGWEGQGKPDDRRSGFEARGTADPIDCVEKLPIQNLVTILARHMCKPCWSCKFDTDNWLLVVSFESWGKLAEGGGVGVTHLRRSRGALTTGITASISMAPVMRSALGILSGSTMEFRSGIVVLNAGSFVAMGYLKWRSQCRWKSRLVKENGHPSSTEFRACHVHGHHDLQWRLVSGAWVQQGDIYKGRVPWWFKRGEKLGLRPCCGSDGGIRVRVLCRARAVSTAKRKEWERRWCIVRVLSLSAAPRSFLTLCT